jgi:hypothetical protein
VTFPGRDALEVDALRTDRYLESLLIAHDRRASDAPADAGLDPAVRDAATRLGRDLVRLHPSFRFEERLAARLAEVAASMRLATAAGAEGAPLVPVPFGAQPDPVDPDDPYADVLRLSRPILIGGALTSAALSIVGAAWVAWRRSRATQSPMARAVRAAHQARLAGAGAAGTAGAPGATGPRSLD